MNSLGWSGHDISRDGAQVGEPVMPAQKQSEQESRSSDSAWYLDKKVNISAQILKYRRRMSPTLSLRN